MKIIDESEKIDDEKEIKDLLTNYVEKEMSFIHEKDMPGYQHTYSRRYRRKQKKIFWTEKYFGTNLHLGYAVKRVAIVILLIFGLTATSKVSAAIFGFDPWEYFISFLSDSKMDVKVYKNSVKNPNNIKYPKVVRNIPKGVPKQFKQSDVKKMSIIFMLNGIIKKRNIFNISG